MGKASQQARLPPLERLLGAVALAAAEPDPRRQALRALSGLARVLEARVAVIVRVHVHPDTGVMVYDEMITAGDWTHEQQAAVMEYNATDHGVDPFFEAVRKQLVGLKPTQLSFGYARQQLVPDGAWYGDPFYRVTRRRMGLDSSVYAGLRDQREGVERGWWLGGGVHRAIAAPQFTAAEAQLVERFLLGIRPMLEAFAGKAETSSSRFLSSLTPRHRELVLELLSGRSGKQIAARLGLKEQSVQTYCKRLYRQLKVSGRPELVALCQRHGVREAFMAADGVADGTLDGVAKRRRRAVH